MLKSESVNFQSHPFKGGFSRPSKLAPRPSELLITVAIASSEMY